MADYVIVGAGSAGCVLASRLSEDPDVAVLVLEAGGPDTAAELHVPAMFPVVFKSSLDWDLLGEPEPGLDGRRLYMPRGRVIGGSSSINAMIYIRGNRARLRRVGGARAARAGATTRCCPYFKRSEDNERGEDAYHGVGGPLAVSESRSMTRSSTPARGGRAGRATSSTPTSTASARTESGASSSRSGTACAAARPTRSCIRR